MKQWLLILILVLCSVPLVSAGICEDILTPGEECTMLTPAISGCTVYNYSIINETANVTKGNLSEVWGGVYSFTFNLSQGDYLVKLCDGSTREIIVGGEDSNMWLAIIVCMGIMTALFLYISMMIREKDLKWIKVMFLGLGIVNAFLMGMYPLLISLNPKNAASFLPVAIGMLSVSGICLIYFIWSYGAYLVERFYNQEERH